MKLFLHFELAFLCLVFYSFIALYGTYILAVNDEKYQHCTDPESFVRGGLADVFFFS